MVAFRGCGEESSRLDCTFEGGGPDRKLAVIANGGSDKFGQRTGIEFATLGDVGIAADLAGEIEFGFAVLEEG